MCATTLCLLLALVFLLWKVLQAKLKNRPPSLDGLPLVGIMHKLTLGNMPQQLQQLGRGRGGIYYIAHNVLSVDDPDIATDVMVKEDPQFANRDGGFLYVAKRLLTDDILFSNYDAHLSQMRKAAHHALNLQGGGWERLEGIVQGELRVFLDDIHDKCGTDVTLEPLLYGLVINIMTSLIFGETFSLDSEEVKLAQEIDVRCTRVATPLDVPEVNVFPWLLNVPLPRYMEKKRNLEEVQALFRRFQQLLIHKYQASYDQNNIRSVLDSLLKSQQTFGTDFFTNETILGISADLIIAGSLTTTSTMAFILLALAQRPDIQARIMAEITTSVGESRLPTIEDKESMPYVTAVIREALRYNSVAALHIPRVNPKDAKLRNFDIPRKTTIMINQWAIHHNPDKWENPDDFNPERFLDEEGQLISIDDCKKRGYIPFGAGRRVCLGEAFAKNRLFLFLATTVQRFKILPPKDSQLPKICPETFCYDGIMRLPKYAVQFEARE